MKKKGVKQFKKMNLVLSLVWFVVLFLLYILVKKWWLGLIIFGVTYFIYAKINEKLRYKYIESILYQDFDAKRYYDELYLKSKLPPVPIQYLVSRWFVGNHKQMESILEEYIKNGAGNEQNVYLSYLKFVYFETRNKEKLSQTLERAEVFPKGITGQFFSHYLNGEYDNCLAECDKIEEWLKNLKDKNKNMPFGMLRLNFMRAVVYYDMGEIDKSRVIFEMIIQKTPNIHYADISAEYLKAIETGDEQYISTEALFIDRYQVENPQLNKKRPAWFVVISWILFVAMVIVAVWGFWLNDSNNNAEPQNEGQILYNQGIREYLDDCFDDYEMIYDFYFNLEDIFIIKSSGKYSIVGYSFELNEDNKPITQFTIYVKDVEFDNRYESYLCSNYSKVSFMITEDYYHVSPESFFTEKIELDGKQYYFSMASVRSTLERYNEALDEAMTDEFGEYDVLYSHYLGDESAYIIKSDDKLNIVIFGFEIDEWDKTSYWRIVKDNIDFETVYSAYSRDHKATLNYLITESNENISVDALVVKPISIDGKDYFFVIWKESNVSNNSNVSSYDENWNRFQNFVADNTYDIWLENVLNAGIEMPWYIYSDYLKFWIAEYEFTLEYAKDFFDDEESYLSWKAENEAWLELTRELYKKEVSNFDAQMERLEITIPYAKLIRQKVIDTKYFLYQLEINEKMIYSDFGDEYVSLQWKGIETDN